MVALDKLIRQSFLEAVTFELRPEWSREASPANICGKSFVGGAASDLPDA